MSLAFSDTTSLKGLVQMYEREIGANRGDVSGNTNLLKEFTADANLAIDDYVATAIQVSGKWKFDDSNHDDFPEMYTDIVSGQREYSFVTDENGNLILDIFKVWIKDGSYYKELTPADSDTTNFITKFQGTETGLAEMYDKTANIIRLDLLPSANITDGLKVSINREAEYFTHTDTTKKVGFPGVHHKYFYLKPAYDYARRNSLNSYPRIEGEMMKMDREIKEYFNRRAKDERPTLNINRESNK